MPTATSSGWRRKFLSTETSPVWERKWPLDRRRGRWPIRAPRRQSLYKGDPGMWAYVLHRITGATIFFFLFVHVLDTALVRVSPEVYTEVIDTYKTPIVGLMELSLVGAVLFHGLNGIRVILIDFWWWGCKYQRVMFALVWAIWLLAMVPATVVLGTHAAEHFGWIG